MSISLTNFGNDGTHVSKIGTKVLATNIRRGLIKALNIKPNYNGNGRQMTMGNRYDNRNDYDHSNNQHGIDRMNARNMMGMNNDANLIPRNRGPIMQMSEVNNGNHSNNQRGMDRMSREITSRNMGMNNYAKICLQMNRGPIMQMTGMNNGNNVPMNYGPMNYGNNVPMNYDNNDPMNNGTNMQMYNRANMRNWSYN